MAANNSMLPKASEYVITTMSDLAKYARLLSQYYHITRGQQDVFFFFANELELYYLQGKGPQHKTESQERLRSNSGISHAVLFLPAAFLYSKRKVRLSISKSLL
ncbi:MAG TPA: hypothetical protein VE548_14775 [Nitrososphaeraceae archaeon]|nr:hypothetical protein [Nitrososphaeraceae archaeon]